MAPSQYLWDENDAKRAPKQILRAVNEWIINMGPTEPFNPHYDEAIYSAPANHRNLNPHLKVTRQGDPPELPLEGLDHFTVGPFPRTYIPPWRHTGNLEKGLTSLITNKGPSLLILIPHGSGRVMVAKGKQLAEKFQKILRAIRFKSYDGKGVMVTVQPPVPAKGGTTDLEEAVKNPHAQPWGFIVDLTADHKGILREFLLYQEVFGYTPKRSFSIYPATSDDPFAQSWKLLVISGVGLQGTGLTHKLVIEQRRELLALVKNRLRTYQPYRSLIDTLAAVNLNYGGSSDTIFDTVAATFHLEPTTVQHADDGPIPGFIWMARPLTNDRKELTQLRDYMLMGICGHVKNATIFACNTVVSFTDDTKRGPIRVDCKLCKSDIHRTADCPIPTARGWRGAKLANLGLEEDAPPEGDSDDSEADDHAMDAVYASLQGGTRGTTARGGRGGGGNRGRGSGRGRGRGGRGQGGRGRGRYA
ncbi:uncharacterized protein BXZ73DRAFT_44236 [Epithele typhae]|uniref:uncharacterized protein n=1 Tax=Epithele typhae TaxID=378194 RepID=UPI002007F2F7|nr:uncharacterized protein BXZ73DRAFT_44236 [Epithele typhae]KAH9938949.1 hypothetical protein BXZ73DRAFT_44236 [Epithele typhae]